MPHYVATVPSPKATLALLRRLEDLLEMPIDTAELDEAAVEYERRLDEAVASEPEVRALVERLERQIDDEDDLVPQPALRRLDRARSSSAS